MAMSTTTTDQQDTEQRLLIIHRGHHKWVLKNPPGLETTDDFIEFKKIKLEDCDYKFLAYVQRLLASPEWRGWRFKYWLRNVKGAQRRWPEFDRTTKRIVVERTRLGPSGLGLMSGGFTTADMVPSTKIKDEMLSAASTAAAAAAAAANADPPAYTPKSLKYTHTV